VKKKQMSLTTGQIVGIVLGVAAIVLFGVLLWYLYKRHQREEDNDLPSYRPFHETEQHIANNPKLQERVRQFKTEQARKRHVKK
jgi:hypothetical protein